MKEPSEKEVNSTKEKCILHEASTKISSKEKLVSIQTNRSWLKLVEAAKVRIYLPILAILPTLCNNEVPKMQYHRKCQSLFTLKRELESLKRKMLINEDSPNKQLKICESYKHPIRNKEPSSRILKKICLFCKKTKMLKGNITRERLILATQLLSQRMLH